MSEFLAGIEFIRFILAIPCILFGVFVFLVAVVGIFKFDYVLNRLHVAAKCDGCGITFIFIGLGLISGLTMTTLKLFLIFVLVWFTSPVSAHMITNTEIITNPHASEEMEVIKK